MSTQLIICLVIFVLTCAGYMTGIWSLGTVAMTSLAALSLTGCLTAKDALAYFANSNVIMIAAMSVVSATAVPYMMNYGGYDQASLVKGGWLYAIISCVVSVGWMMTMYPVL